MVSPDQFKAFYDMRLLPILQELEVERKILARRARNMILLPILITAPASFILLADTQPGIVAFVIFLTLFLGAGIYWLTSRKRIHAFKYRFKTEVVHAMIKTIDENLNYDHNRFIPESDYKKSRLFLSGHTRYTGDDLVSGILGKTAIRFSELNVIKRVKSGKDHRDVTIFKGILFIGDFNKHFKSETVVLPDIAENLLGNFLGGIVQSMSVGRDKVVKLEDPEFEQAFVVHSNDQVEARYVLSAALMRRLLDFRAKLRARDLRISFIDSHVYIAVPVSKDLFEVSVLRTVLNFEVMKTYYDYLVLFTGVVDDLNLNNRIWTKE